MGGMSGGTKTRAHTHKTHYASASRKRHRRVSRHGKLYKVKSHAFNAWVNPLAYKGDVSKSSDFIKRIQKHPKKKRDKAAEKLINQLYT